MIVKVIGPVRQGCNQACHELFCKEQLYHCTSTLQAFSNADTPRHYQEVHCKLDTNHVIMASERGSGKKVGLAASCNRFVEWTTSLQGRDLRLVLGLVHLNV